MPHPRRPTSNASSGGLPGPVESTPEHREASALARGEQARQLLENPLLIEAFEAIRNGLRHRWETSAPDDEAVRDECWRMLRVVGKVEAVLRSTVTTGTLTARERAQREAAAERERAIRHDDGTWVE